MEAKELQKPCTAFLSGYTWHLQVGQVPEQRLRHVYGQVMALRPLLTLEQWWDGIVP